MAEKEFLGPPVTVKKTLVFDQKDLYKHLKKAFKDRGYSFLEKDYGEGVNSEGLRTTYFFWEAKKKASGYVSLMLNLRFDSAALNVKIKKDDKEMNAQKGDVVLKFTGFIKKDPESEWELYERRPYGAFFRELYDKFVRKGHYDELVKTLDSDLKAIIEEAKLFMKMRRYD